MRKKSNITKEEIGIFFLGLIPVIPVSSGIYVGFRLAAYKDGVLLQEDKSYPVFVGAVVTMVVVAAIMFGIYWVVQSLAGKLRGDHQAEAIQEEDQKDIEKRRIARAREWCSELWAIDEQKKKYRGDVKNRPPRRRRNRLTG